MRKRHRQFLSSLHRWVGGGCALFLVALSLTGLALNHSERLGLDRIRIQADWVLERYGMAFPAPSQVIAREGRYGAVMDGNFWWEGTEVAPLETVLGFASEEGWILVGGPTRALLLTPEGTLIDVLSYPAGAVSPEWGRVDAQVAIGSRGQRWVLGSDLAKWVRTEEAMQSAPVPFADFLPEAVLSEWKSGYTGPGLSLYRVILDIHAGRFFGLPGTFAMDATAVAILYLCVSGLVVWWSRRGNGRNARV